MNPPMAPERIQRLDYRPAPYRMPTIELHFSLDAERTLVTAEARYERAEGQPADAPLILDGEDLEIVELALDGTPLALSTDASAPAGAGPTAQTVGESGSVTLRGLPEAFTLRTVVAIRPAANHQLSGLYASGPMMLTQCEAQGFRRITLAQDRPDVMSRYRVTLEADAAQFPVLLANGNLIEEERGAQRHRAVWEDPFPKPTYLFALVAGTLEVNERTHTTGSGRTVLLQVWCEPGQRDRTHHAMESLVRAIEWDERRYGLELDLDRFMIVATADFNMGAMENKGLNIFNAKYVFADPAIATDDDYERIESIIGHEYFHNWTGNRVTCRDWFQLTLKEGLTVFRDQQFTGDCLAAGAGDDAAAAASARAVNRIENVRVLRAMQFAEDAGPMSHPIRPDSYLAIDNFYTATVYEKGAEVIRMLATLTGEAGFRAGMDLYFARHDGQAVTCDDFVAAIADANRLDLTQFMRWYDTAGTPVLHAHAVHDPLTATCTLTLSQRMRRADGSLVRPAAPLQIPVQLGLLDAQTGAERLATTIALEAAEQSFSFPDQPTAPVLSLLRGYSAPVILEHEVEDAELAFLIRHDTDAFNRWDATQRLMTRAIHRQLEAHPGAAASTAALVEALAAALQDPGLDAGMRRQLLLLPGEGPLTEQLQHIVPEALRAARRSLMHTLAQRLEAPLAALLAERVACATDFEPWRPGDVRVAARRALANTAMVLLAGVGHAGAIALAQRLCESADNMTDRSSALQALLGTTPALRDAALARFAETFAGEPNVMDKWFMLQATMHRLEGDEPVLTRVRALMRHPAWSASNPNKVRALIQSFCAGNLAEFHLPDGSGYRFWTEQVLALDATNPQVAARLARALDRWTRLPVPRRDLMQEALQTVLKSARSTDVREIVARSLESAPVAESTLAEPTATEATLAGSAASVPRSAPVHPAPLSTPDPSTSGSHSMTTRQISLTQYLVEKQREKGLIPGELRLLLEVVARACRRIGLAVSRGAVSDLYGDAGGQENIQGEVQKKLDVIANSVLLEANEWGGHLAAMASEEMEGPYHIPNRYPRGEFLLMFDPLDGSSNIDVNVSIGTIFSVLRLRESTPQVSDQHFLQPGTRQLAAGYAIYGPSTQLVLTVGDGVAVFTFDRETGSWVLTRDRMQIPVQTREFSANTSNVRHWHAPMLRYYEELQAGVTGPRRKDFNMRWIASMVADVHRILTRGGVFMYPADRRDPDKPGKLRLMYEANPMAFLVEQAGGVATDGIGRILDIQPTALHQRVPVFLGSREEVDVVTRYHREAAGLGL